MEPQAALEPELHDHPPAPPARSIFLLEPIEMTARPAEGWRAVALPTWLERRGDRLFVHAETHARLYRHVDFWEDGAMQEMWSVYVTSPDKPDAVCVRLDLALAMYDRFRRTGFLPKGSLLPWRT